jgi:hypothetical protein
MDRATQLSPVARAVTIVALAAIAVFAIVGLAAVAVIAVTNGKSIVDDNHVHDTFAQANTNANAALARVHSLTVRSELVFGNRERAMGLHRIANRNVQKQVLALPYYGIGDAQQALVAKAVTALLAHGIAYTLPVGSKLVFSLELTVPDGVLALPWYMRDTNVALKVSILVSVYLLALAHIF